MYIEPTGAEPGGEPPVTTVSSTSTTSTDSTPAGARLRVALAQVTSTDDPAHNLRIIEQYARAAAADGTALVVFPEAMMCRPAADSSTSRNRCRVRGLAGSTRSRSPRA